MEQKLKDMLAGWVPNGYKEAEDKLTANEATTKKLEAARELYATKYKELIASRDYKTSELEIIKNNKVITLEKIDKLLNIQKERMRMIEANNRDAASRDIEFHILQKHHEAYKEAKAQLLASQEENTLYANILDHKSGLPHLILKENANIICTRMNELLAELCDFRVKFEFTAISFYLNIVQGPGGCEEFDSSLGSGFQKFVINLVLRIVAASQVYCTMPNFLIIDEGFGCLDANNLLAVTKMLHKIKKYFDFVLIISHIQELQNLSDIQLLITTDSRGISRLCNCNEPKEYRITGRDIQKNKSKEETKNDGSGDFSCIVDTGDTGAWKLKCTICGTKLQSKTTASRHLASQGHKNKAAKNH